MEKNDPRLKVGSVVQINPETQLGDKQGCFAMCFMTVSELKYFGATGWVMMPGKRGDMPGQAYLRATWEEMEYVGEAVWRNITI